MTTKQGSGAVQFRRLWALRLIDSWAWARRHAGWCDDCGKYRFGLRAMGRDSNGDPDAPDVCFLCRGGTLVRAAAVLDFAR